MNNESEPSPILAKSEQWVLVPSPKARSTHEQSYFLIWTSDDPIHDRMIAACKQIVATKNLFPGTQIEFTSEPSPGLIIHTLPAWSLNDFKAAQQFLEKIVWELERLTKG